MKNRYQLKNFILIILLFAVFFISLNHCNKSKVKKMHVNKYIYSDGNGNSYNISISQGKYYLKYNPVTPKRSSSGIYSGGIAKNVVLEKQAFEKLLILFEKAKTNKEIHLDKRIMTSGLIIYVFSKNTERYIIEGSSKENKDILSFLKSLLK